MKTIDETRGDTRSATKMMRRLHQKVGTHTISVHDVMLTAIQRAGRDLANTDRTPLPSRIPTHLRPNHRDEATQQEIAIGAHATTTTRTMSTLAETIADATTAAM
jgi:hypothetical protein